MTHSNVLPSNLEQVLRTVGRRLVSGESVEADIPEAIAGINELPPSAVGQAHRAIIEAAHLYHWQPERSFLLRRLSRPLSQAEQLLSVPGLQYLFVFHADGRLREAALRRITGPLPSAFLFVAVATRLNDWAKPVREAALECARRSFVATPAEMIAASAEVLLLRSATWQRWGDERQAVEDAFSRADVCAELANRLSAALVGPASRLLRTALRFRCIDDHLEALAMGAIQPAVRAVALQSVADMRASWQDGWDWQWIDKSMGVRRAVPRLRSRDLTVHPDRDRVVTAGIEDRSAVVRRSALSALIKHRLHAAETVELAGRLIDDPSPSVRERANFVLSHAAKMQREG